MQDRRRAIVIDTVTASDDAIRAGAVAIGLGSWLIGDGVATGVAERATQVVRAVADARGSQRSQSVSK